MRAHAAPTTTAAGIKYSEILGVESWPKNLGQGAKQLSAAG
jgi:hypothetical protein